MNSNLSELCKLIRYYILISTTEAGSGHPTSSLSAVELMATLMFDGGFFKYDLQNPENETNDRLIFSKGHASPLFYALFAAAGKLKEQDILGLRQFQSPLEGHPTMRFPYTEVATGSLGQGLSIGLGMALNAKLEGLSYKTYVLLGDSEMAEGSNWEAIQLANYYKLDNLIGIIDVNRLGQRGETMYGHDVFAYEKRVQAFGWDTHVVSDGHNLDEVRKAFEFALSQKSRPAMIIAKTMKGKGCSIWENKENWHSKQLSNEQLFQCIQEMGKIDKAGIGVISEPEKKYSVNISESSKQIEQVLLDNRNYSTKEASGIAVCEVGREDARVVVLDAEVSNSTHSELFKEQFPNRFFEMFIAEQNMVGTALGLSRRGKIPFVFTFAAFFTRAFDQIRMSQYSNPNIKFIGSYAGVSLGKDGSSQMGLEDIAMFRAIQNCVVLQPSDAVSMIKLLKQSALHFGNVYLRAFREAVPALYNQNDEFRIGGSKIIRSDKQDKLAVVASGITVHEALKAYEMLLKDGISIRILDLYSISPIDDKTLKTLVDDVKLLLVVEDHYPQGGIAEAVKTAVCKNDGNVHSLSVEKMPRSGTPAELLHYESIDAEAIVKKVKEILE